jgi:hypothetical protein
MKRKALIVNFLLVFVFSVISVQAQSTYMHLRDAKKAYKKGLPLIASLEAIKVLKIKPNKKGAQKILSLSYDSAIKEIKSKIEALQRSSSNFQGDKTVKEKERIVELYELMQRLNRDAYNLGQEIHNSKYNLNFELLDFSNEIQKAKNEYEETKLKTAEMHYNNAMKLYNTGGRNNFKKAAKEFKAAMKFVPDYKDSKTMYEDARKKGITRIAIFAFDNKSGNPGFGEIGELVSDRLAAKLFNDKEFMEFVEIISRDELEILMQEHKLSMSVEMDPRTAAKNGKLMGVHLIVTGKIMQASAEHQPVINDAPYTVSANVVVGQETYVNSKGKTKVRNVYGPVYAKIYEHRKSSKAILSGSYKVLDVETGKILDQNQFSETYVWLNRWITFSGDERAVRIPRDYDANELNPPTDFEMGNKLVDKLTDKMAAKIKKLLE